VQGKNRRPLLFWQGIFVSQKFKRYLASSVFVPHWTYKNLQRVSPNSWCSSLRRTAVSCILATEFTNDETRKTKGIILHSTGLARNNFHVIFLGKLNTINIWNRITNIINNNGSDHDAENLCLCVCLRWSLYFWEVYQNFKTFCIEEIYWGEFWCECPNYTQDTHIKILYLFNVTPEITHYIYIYTVC
jgi:hypothetical protein